MISISKALQEYLNLRRKLGFKLEEDGRVLAKFVSFLEEQGVSQITTELAVRWAVKPRNAQPRHWARRLRMVRLFAEYRSATDPRTEVPPQKLLPDLYHRKPPYIYTDEQVMRLLEAARQLTTEPGPIVRSLDCFQLQECGSAKLSHSTGRIPT